VEFLREFGLEFLLLAAHLLEEYRKDGVDHRQQRCSERVHYRNEPHLRVLEQTKDSSICGKHHHAAANDYCALVHGSFFASSLSFDFDNTSAAFGAWSLIRSCVIAKTPTIPL
jgi:hypothetical protein